MTMTVWVSSWKAPASPANVNHDGYAHVDALAGAGSFLYGGGRKGKGRRRRRILRGPRVVEGCYLHDFLGNSFLEAVSSALEVPSLLEDLFKGFLAFANGDQESLSPRGHLSRMAKFLGMRVP